MAATRLIALHVNKGKSVAQCLADRTDYSQNAEKTNNGEFISSYECDPKTADEEFLLSKRQYQLLTEKKQAYAEYRQVKKEVQVHILKSVLLNANHFIKHHSQYLLFS